MTAFCSSTPTGTLSATYARHERQRRADGQVDAPANHAFTLALGFGTDQAEPSRLVALRRRSRLDAGTYRTWLRYDARLTRLPTPRPEPA